MQIAISEVTSIEVTETHIGENGHQWTTIMVHSAHTRLPVHIDLHSTNCNPTWTFEEPRNVETD